MKTSEYQMNKEKRNKRDKERKERMKSLSFLKPNSLSRFPSYSNKLTMNKQSSTNISRERKCLFPSAAQSFVENSTNFRSKTALKDKIFGNTMI